MVMMPGSGSVLFMRDGWTGSVRGDFVVHTKGPGAEI